jgi:integrase
MSNAEVEPFLTHLAVQGPVSASTQNQAFYALLFLYQQVREIDLGPLDAVRARRPKRLPVVLAPEEVAAVLPHVQGAEGVFQLMVRLLYGCGLRLLEGCPLPVKDVHLARGQIVVRAGKGNKDRVVMLPQSVRADLQSNCKGDASSTSATCSAGWPASISRTPWSGNIRGRPRSWAGSSCSLRGSCRTVRRQAGWDGTTCIPPRCSGAWPRPGGAPPACVIPCTATRSATALRRTWSNAAWTSARSSNSWDTRASKRP